MSYAFCYIGPNSEGILRKFQFTRIGRLGWITTLCLILD